MQLASDTVSHFIAHLRHVRHYSEHTSIAYENDLVAFFVFIENEFGDTDPVNITGADDSLMDGFPEK